MSEEEIIEKILRDYPIGTKFKSAFSGKAQISRIINRNQIGINNIDQVFIEVERLINHTTGRAYVKYHKNWAEIIQDEPNIYII